VSGEVERRVIHRHAHRKDVAGYRGLKKRSLENHRQRKKGEGNELEWEVIYRPINPNGSGDSELVDERKPT